MSPLHGLLLALLWTGAAHGSSAGDWLMRIHDAAETLSYQGVFVYAYGSNLETMQVAHKVDNDMVRERIFSLNGAPREIVRDAEQVWCYVPEEDMGVHEYRQVPKQNFTKLLPEQIGRLGDSYSLTLGKQDRIADRAAQQVLVDPVDEYRYGYALWADVETGLLLKASLVSPGGEPVEQYMFTRISIGDDVDALHLSPKTDRNKLKWFGAPQNSVAAIENGVSTPGWAIDKLPKGFEKTIQIKRLSPINNKPIEHYVYTDGLAAVSVFIEMLDDQDQSPLTDGLHHIGAVHAFGHTQDGYHITVIGSVPSQTVDMMGTSVKKTLE